MIFSKIIIIEILIVFVAILLTKQYWKKMDSTTRYGALIAILFFTSPLITTIIKENSLNEEFELLNRPYIEPSIKIDETHKGEYNILFKNNGQITAKNVIYSIECKDQSYNVTNISTEISPNGISNQQISFLKLNDFPLNIKLKLHYNGQYSNKSMDYESTYFFNISENQIEIKPYNSSHLQKEKTIYSNEITLQASKKLDSEIGTLVFWLDPKKYETTELLLKSKSKEIFYIPEKKIVLLNWYLKNGKTLMLINEIPKDSSTRSMITFNWTTNDTAFILQSYINEKLNSDLILKKE